MSASRERILRELGLGPTWRLRSPPDAAPVQVAPLPAVVEPAAPGLTEHAGVAAAGGPEDWDRLAAAVRDCRACGLCAARKQAVLGVGDRQADWLFVGEGPGAEEDQRGEPFVGQAGKLLDNMLAAIGLRRGDDVYIANAVKCRPPENRTPDAPEIDACRPYLEQQIALIRPKMIVALGRPAAQALLNAEVKIAAARGRLHDYQGIPLVITYHPAYLLRNLTDKARAWEDLCFMRRSMRHLKDG